MDEINTELTTDVGEKANAGYVIITLMSGKGEYWLRDIILVIPMSEKGHRVIIF